MNLIEAIKSGRRFRRKGEKSWYSAISDNYALINISAISRENFIADDWEVQSPSVTITREEFDAAWTKALECSVGFGTNYDRFQAMHWFLTADIFIRNELETLNHSKKSSS